MAVDARHRGKDGEISRKHGNTLIRKTYGPRFAPGCADHAKLSDVLGKLDELSLSHLRRDRRLVVHRLPSWCANLRPVKRASRPSALIME